MAIGQFDTPFRRPVETAAHRAIETHLTPGMAIAVVRNGTIVYEKGFGVSGPGESPVTPTTRFAIGSLTKQFTATGILVSAHHGKIKLDNPLATYIPSLVNSQLITVRELLNQTSGLHTYPNLREHNWPLKGSMAPSAIFSLLASDPSDFKPGTQFQYSNTNYAALAEIIAQANETSYGSFFLLLATRPYFSTLGEPKSLLLQEKTVRGKMILYRYRGEFSDGSVHDVRLAMDGEKIGGFQVPP